MREIITCQFGQCGNQLGQAFWRQIVTEHGLLPTDSSSTFFDETTQQSRARAILVDMEPGVLNVIRASETAPLFTDQQFMSGDDGSGNNFGEGYFRHGGEQTEKFVQIMQNQLEKCDSPQAVQTFQSLGGGTGSGLGSRLIEEIRDRFKFSIISACVIPSRDTSDVITSPYNSVCSMASLLESSDVVLPFDNDRMFQAAQVQTIKPKSLAELKPSNMSMYDILLKQFKGEQPQNSKNAQKKPFTEANKLVALSMSSLSASMRFGGEINIDLNDIATNLIPFKDLNICLVNYSPLSEAQNLTGKLKQLFSINNNLSTTQTDQLTLANIIFSRSKDVDLGLMSQTFDSLAKNDKFIKEQQFKIGITTGGVENLTDFCWLRNGETCASTLDYIFKNYSQLKSKRMYLHHYLKFMEESELDRRSDVINKVLQGYKGMQQRINGDEVIEEEQQLKESVKAALV
ncbi:Epsilon_tubulin [Hexamita inflata]|uniref:Epsilon tubulin n=1 Tax=Hexamita inflata TaxID=28002 RepID=A0AA86NYD8_9EUKA|nr:Epsilon tubulin [Hexamita inflata]